MPKVTQPISGIVRSRDSVYIFLPTETHLHTSTHAHKRRGCRLPAGRRCPTWYPLSDRWVRGSWTAIENTTLCIPFSVITCVQVGVRDRTQLLAAEEMRTWQGPGDSGGRRHSRRTGQKACAGPCDRQLEKHTP